jgi:hypothetical protein
LARGRGPPGRALAKVFHGNAPKCYDPPLTQRGRWLAGGIAYMFCHTCGTQVDAGLQFCPNCGQPIGGAPGAFAGTAVPAVPWTPPTSVTLQTGRWIDAGWQMVKADLGNFVLIALIFTLLNGMVPFIIQGPLLVGFHIYCIKRMLNRPAEFGDLFKGFNMFVPALVACLLISLFTSLGALACIIPGLVIAAMYKFTYLFILDKHMDFWPAMQASHAVVKNDYVGFTLFLVLLGLINLLGVLCCFVGIFVTIPLSIAAITAAYRDIVGFEPSTAETL